MSNETDRPSEKPQHFTLEELDEFGTMGGPNMLPFPLDHDIWQDKRNRPKILAAIEEKRRG